MPPIRQSRCSSNHEAAKAAFSKSLQDPLPRKLVTTVWHCASFCYESCGKVKTSPMPVENCVGSATGENTFFSRDFTSLANCQAEMHEPTSPRIWIHYLKTDIDPQSRKAIRSHVARKVNRRPRSRRPPRESDTNYGHAGHNRFQRDSTTSLSSGTAIASTDSAPEHEPVTINESRSQEDRTSQKAIHGPTKTESVSTSPSCCSEADVDPDQSIREDNPSFGTASTTAKTWSGHSDPGRAIEGMVYGIAPRQDLPWICAEYSPDPAYKCNRVFETCAELDQHQRQYHSYYRCKVCAAFERIENRTEHGGQHEEGLLPNVECCFCGDKVQDLFDHRIFSCAEGPLGQGDPLLHDVDWDTADPPEDSTPITPLGLGILSND